MKFRGLRTKLTVAFFLLSLLPLILMGLVSVYLFQISREFDIADMERSFLKQKNDETQKFIEETTGMMEIKVPYEETAIIQDSSQAYLLQKLLQENKYINEAAFIDMTGMETKKISRVQNAAMMGLNNVREMPKFLFAKTGQKYFGEVNDTMNGPVMTVSAPVLNNSGNVIMVLSCEISLSSLRNVYKIASLGNSGYFYAADSKGYIIGSSRPSLTGTNVSANVYKKLSDSNGVLTSKKGLNASEVLTMSLPISSLGWTGVVEWPKTDAFETASNLRDEFAIFCLAVFIMVMFMIWLIGNRIMKPIATLSDGAQKFGEEKFDHEIKINTGDEIEGLGNIMNKMASDLKHHHEELEKSHQKIEDNLREIAKLKDDFIFVAAHELRSPVTVLQGYVAEILDDQKTVKMLKKANPYFLDMVKGIEISKDRLSTLVDDLLNIARMEAGKFKINIREGVKIEDIKPIVENMNEMGKQRGIKVIFKTEGKIPLLRIDPDRLGELLVNLISNGIKYNKDKGKVTVTASYKAGEIWFEVADNGIGMSEEDQKHLFEKFWRSEDVNKLQGTGLGLFIVKHMLNQLGGDITFTSKKGKGTTFTFHLPAK